MNTTVILAILTIGFAAGLRGMTPLAVVAWCAYLGCINLGSTPFAFISSPIALAIFSFLALVEYVWDLRPNVPSRTEAGGLISRIVTGSLAAACLLAATNNSLAFCILGGGAAAAGAFAGSEIRARLVRGFAVKDVYVAIPEDFIAIGLSVCAVYLAASA